MYLHLSAILTNENAYTNIILINVQCIYAMKSETFQTDKQKVINAFNDVFFFLQRGKSVTVILPLKNFSIYCTGIIKLVLVYQD